MTSDNRVFLQREMLNFNHAKNIPSENLQHVPAYFKILTTFGDFSIARHQNRTDDGKASGRNGANGRQLRSLFSKRATLYKEMGLKDEKLSEADFKRYILEHYTFLSRPVILADGQIFVGNSPKVVQQAIAFLSHE